MLLEVTVAEINRTAPKPIDLRTAALVVAIERVAHVALERGISRAQLETVVRSSHSDSHTKQKARATVIPRSV